MLPLRGKIAGVGVLLKACSCCMFPENTEGIKVLGRDPKQGCCQGSACVSIHSHTNFPDRLVQQLRWSHPSSWTKCVTHDTYTCERQPSVLHCCCQTPDAVKEQRNALNFVMHAFGRRVMLLAARLSPEMEIHNSVCGSVSSIKTLSLFLLSKYI